MWPKLCWHPGDTRPAGGSPAWTLSAPCCRGHPRFASKADAARCRCGRAVSPVLTGNRGRLRHALARAYSHVLTGTCRSAAPARRTRHWRMHTKAAHPTCCL